MTDATAVHCVVALEKTKESIVSPAEIRVVPRSEVSLQIKARGTGFYSFGTVEIQ